MQQSAASIQLSFLPLTALKTVNLVKHLKRLAVDQVWVAGGDGTVISIAGQLEGEQIPLGILPLGTMNLLARDAGMSLELTEAAEQLVNARPVLIDMAFMNDKPYLCLSNIGMSTRLTALREALRQHRAWSRWPLMCFYLLRFVVKFPAMEVELVQDGRCHRLKTRSISISNNRLSDSGGLIPRRNQLNCGVLGVYAVRDRSLWTLPRMVLRLFSRDWFGDKDLLSFEATQVAIRFKKYRKVVSVMCDGELSQEAPPLEYRIRPQSVMLLCPGEQK